MTERERRASELLYQAVIQVLKKSDVAEVKKINGELVVVAIQRQVQEKIPNN